MVKPMHWGGNRRTSVAKNNNSSSSSSKKSPSIKKERKLKEKRTKVNYRLSYAAEQANKQPDRLVKDKRSMWHVSGRMRQEWQVIK